MKTRGWNKVFSFTAIQYIKTKSFIIGTVVMCLIVALIAAGVNILPGLFSNDEEADEEANGDITTFSAVYIIDDAKILAAEDIDTLKAAGLAVTDTDKSFEELNSYLSELSGKEALIYIAPDYYKTTDTDNELIGYTVKTYYSPDCDKDASSTVSNIVSTLVSVRNLVNLGVAPEDYAASQRHVNSVVIAAGSQEWNFIESALNYFVPIVVSLILFIFIFAYGQGVAQSIATEKTGRVMELLLTSIRPLAVVIGKVFAMGVISLAQFILLALVGGGTFMLTAPFGIGGKVMDIMSSPELQELSENAEIVEAMDSFGKNFSALNIITIVVIFILGFLFYSLIAALVGASISRIEDLQQAMQPYSLLGVLGVYLAYFPVMFNLDSIESGVATTNPIQIFSYYFPVSSPFALPSAMLLGTMSGVQVAIAVVILAVFDVLVAMLVGKVYEAIILHNGSRLKMGDIVKIALRK